MLFYIQIWIYVHVLKYKQVRKYKRVEDCVSDNKTEKYIMTLT